GREHGRAGPRRTSDLESLVDRVLGQVQLADAVRVHRGVAGGGVKPAPPRLHDECDLPGGERTLLGDTLLELAKHSFIRQTRHRDAMHGALLDGGGWSRADAASIACGFSTSVVASTPVEPAIQGFSRRTAGSGRVRST